MCWPGCGCCAAMTTRPPSSPRRLWDLPGWARTASNCSTTWRRATTFPAGSSPPPGMVRHLLTDPVLPDELLPDGWPGDALRQAYTDFAAELVARRDRVELMEAK